MFKAGYVASVTTWENDADNYITKNLDGLSLDQANAIVELAKFFTSGSNNEGYCTKTQRKVFGNADDGDKFGHFSYRTYYNTEQFEIYLNTIFPELYSVLITINTIENLVYKLIGSWCDGEYIRVAETVNIYYVPEDIHTISSCNLRNF
jgi:hypothetical protein